MTFCKLLAERNLDNGNTVQAYEKTDKYSSVPRYTVTVLRDGIEQYTVKCAKTTWKKRFREIVG